MANHRHTQKWTVGVSLLIASLMVAVSLFQILPARADDPPLRVEILAGYNLVVDSNVTSPSTYAPAVATVAGRFCNTGASTLTDVYGYIGDWAGGASGTPGTYPSRNSAGFSTSDPFYNSGLYAYQHLGGSLEAADATRYIGTLEPDTCKVQYWMIRYPQCKNDPSGNWQYPPCTNPAVGTWGISVKPDDDLWLEFDIWGTADTGSGTTATGATHKMTMRNEISAMANKIWPNDGDWFNIKSGPIEPGDIITSNGINYELGLVNQGFDNDLDFDPDYNAWLQPIGDPSYDPSCFRLIGTTGTITITRSAGNPDLILNVTDQLYFTDLPPDNTGIRGQIHYTYLALGGPCNVDLSPYQEAASGFDNEKFNGDYGTAVPPITSTEPKVALGKTVDKALADPGETLTYALTFTNTGTAPAGQPDYGLPLVIRDAIPAGTSYVAGSATANNTVPNPTPGGISLVRYSTDNGATWTPAEPTPADSVTDLQWWLSAPLAVGASGTVRFQVTVNNPYNGPTPLIRNIGKIGYGEAPPFDEDDATTLVKGLNSIGDTVWKDDGTGTGGVALDGVQNGAEAGIANITVWLYWDDGDGVLDADDPLITTTATNANGAYSFLELPDGDYIVKVDSADPDLPIGYAPTNMTVHPVTDLGVGVTGSAAYLNADFGFGPVLVMDKALTSTDPAYEGDNVTFSITLRNTRPGDGSGQPTPCTHTTWASAYDAAHSGTGNKAWLNYQNAYTPPGPDGAYATAPFANANETMAVTGFSLGPQAGTITGVEVLVPMDVYLTLDGTFQVILYENGADLAPHVYQADALTDGTLVVDVLADRTWSWSDFNGSSLSIQLLADKGSNPPGDLNVDAVGFRVTTDQQCGGPDDMIAILPLEDTYDADLLEFVSADPTESDQYTTGSPPDTVGTIVWDDLGPLYAGQTKTVLVTFKALEPPDADADGESDPVTTINTALVEDAEFANGHPVNDATDYDDVTINPTGSIGDTIWNDNGNGGGTASNGVQDGGEQGIPGVTVRLYQDSDGDGVIEPATDTLIGTTETDQDGKYLFTGLRDGAYGVVVDTASLPGSTFTQTGDPDATMDNQTTNSLTLNNNDGDSANDDYLNQDFGYLIPNTIYGNVWEDNSGDTNRQEGENGIQGVTVYLYDAGNNLIATTTTDADGNYVFSDLLDGTYYIVVDDTASPLGSDWTNTRDPEGPWGDSQSDPITVGGGNLYGSYDFGYHHDGALSLGDTLYVDWNGDSTQDAGEEGIANITISLYEDSDGDGVIDPTTDALIATTVTDADGYYTFGGLVADDYIVVVDRDDPDWPAGIWTQTQDYDGTRDDQAEIPLTASTDEVDFGYRPIGSGSIGDRVWYDDDGDGYQDSGETGIASVTVNLYEDSNNDGVIDSGDALVATTTTDANGNYSFTGLPAGNYLVDVDTSTAPSGWFLSTDNDPHDVTLAAGQSYLDADFGFTTAGLIGDRIWQDNDGDGVQDPGEPGIQNVVVHLYYDVDGDGVYDPGLDTSVGTDTTDADGIYEFPNMPAGKYVVVVESGIPSGFQQTGDPDATLDNEHGLTLWLGQIDRSNDFGYRPQGVIGDTLWIDADGDGTRDADELGVPDVTVSLYNDVNGNGVYDAGTDTLVTATVTDINGNYNFGNLPEGNYVVVVDGADPDLAGLTQTYDPDATINNEHGLYLPSGGTNLDVDFGYQRNGAYSVSGYVFFDSGNNGGTYTPPNDLPYSGITVYLWDANHQLIGTTTTDANGYYSFPGLSNGDYTISINRNEPELAGMTQTTSPYNWPVTIADASQDHKDFGFFADMDFGDLPDTYRTTLANNGPRHTIGSLYLGAGVDAEGDGLPDPAALGDDNNGIPDDEDGVMRDLGDLWTPGNTVDLNITVAGSSGYLVAWFDWNGDGDFADGDEMVDLGSMIDGLNTESVTIPSSATPGDTISARFRLYDGSVPISPSYAGWANNGEVEDYIWPFSPTGVDLISFEAQAQGHAILLTWETANEFDNMGFNLYRAESMDGPQTQLNDSMIPSQGPGSPTGFVYTFLDEAVVPGVIYYYWLEDVDLYDVTTLHGPRTAFVWTGEFFKVYLPTAVK